jgi:hypothetical protein
MNEVRLEGLIKTGFNILIHLFTTKDIFINFLEDSLSPIGVHGAVLHDDVVALLGDPPLLGHSTVAVATVSAAAGGGEVEEAGRADWRSATTVSTRRDMTPSFGSANSSISSWIVERGKSFELT